MPLPNMYGLTDSERLVPVLTLKDGEVWWRAGA
jgi:hypothetical protein